ncbi:outer membrane protein assembly factor BamB [Acidihalobacter ferrooxydans]|uniref:Outer membrane protein assembly factor BamB n=1 Tax=Acidihalobacter ferrooxydans TaxID=1765967 RepID=A0A1P8UGX9_9GAMM|nr:outer membrane protein assembly factor BamB [Acidihalobacter ferrooxydans]APZ43070.1 outer membrane protein assembly factor BamB [Acidihalobacter ferrooxydans]
MQAFMRMAAWFGMLLGVGLLAGCGGAQNTRPPNVLHPIKTELAIKRLWSVNVGTHPAPSPTGEYVGDTYGGGNGGYFLHLHPYVSGPNIYAATYSGLVVAYARKNGHQLWTVDTGHKLVGGVSGGDGMLFVGAQDGKVIGISLKQRGVIWQTQLSSEVMALSEAGQGEVVAHTNDGNLFALDVTTGNVVWSHTTEAPNLILRGKSQPLLVGGTVIAGFANGKLGAFSLASGTELWRLTVAVPQGASKLQRLVDVDGHIALSDSGNTVYAASYNGRVVAAQTSNGQLLWSHPMSSYAGLTVGDGQVFVTGANSDIWALDRSTGAVMWKQDALHFRELTAPALVDGKYLVVGDYAGYLQWLSASDGSILAREEVDSRGIQAAPVVVGNTVYVQAVHGNLAAYRVLGPVGTAGTGAAANPFHIGGFHF